MSKLRILSLGAGVQSTTLALMAAHGEIEPPDYAIFADTQWEPRAVYEHLRWLMSPNVLPFPVHIVTAGNIRDGILLRRNTTGGTFAVVPWFTVNRDGSHAIGRRQCTNEYKLTPIRREIRRLLGKAPRDRIHPGSVDVLIGISLDESYRVKPSVQRYMTHIYPLIDMRMRRYDCLNWLRRHDYPEPPKSACIGCPYTSNERWRERQEQSPGEWADAVAVDAALRQGGSRTEYMHQSRIPLAEVDLSVDDRQADLFGNECEGMCGV